MLAPNVIIVWPGTNATIPTGFTRETALDSKFGKGSADSTDPNTTGGSATHTHTSSAHTHTAVSHSHTGTTGSATGDRQDAGSGSEMSGDGHTHNYNIAGVTGGSLSDAVTYAATSSNPPYYEVIHIKPTSWANVPSTAVIYLNSADVPMGFTECTGASSTPDLRNKYLIGAGTGANAGGTGGTLTHEHAIDHTHTGVTHTNVGTTGTSNSMTEGTDASPGGGAATRNHTHTGTLNASTSETGSAYTGNAGSADTVEPPYHKLRAIQNTSGGSTGAQEKMIAMWLGTLATIPSGWFLCDGNNGTPDLREKFIKICNTAGELGNTGGSTNHTHTASNSHTHTASGTHTHTGSTDTVNAIYGTGVGGNGGSPSHSHSISTSSSATSSWNVATVTGDDSNGEPEYRTVAYIQFAYAAMAGLLGMLV